MQRYIPRHIERNLHDSLGAFPITALLGPRQCGKSTLARKIIESLNNTVFLDLEKPSDLRKLEDPEFFISTQQGKLICLDEVQRIPDLFPVIRSAVDADRRPGRFLILGSASQDLIRQGAESLAGRIHYIELTPFTYRELLDYDRKTYEDFMTAWVRGGFPESTLADSEEHSCTWRHDFIRTFLERDIPQMGFAIPSITVRRFWTMLAHYHGQTLNTSKLGQSLGTTHPTIRRYLDILEQTFMVRVLPPFVTNIKKRLIKSPKVYIRDSGVLHSLLDIDDAEQLLGHPVIGTSWEGWCIEQIVNAMPRWQAYFYRTSSGEEIDLIVERGEKRFAFEFKASMAPKVSKGFPGTMEVLRPLKAWIVAPVTESYQIPEGATVCSLETILDELRATGVTHSR